MLYLVIIASFLIASKSQTTTADPCAGGNYCDPTDTTSCSSGYECLADPGNANGCSYCQIQCPYSCDPLDMNSCSNYGTNYECRSWTYNGNDCNKCQPVITSSTTTATLDCLGSGGCHYDTNCKDPTPICDWSVPGTNGNCGVCVATATTTTTAAATSTTTDACNGAVTCNDASECMNGTPGTANYGSCTDVNNDGCKICVYPTTTTKTATTSTTTATATLDCLGSGGCYYDTNCKDPTPVCDWSVPGTNGNCGVCVATATSTTIATATDPCAGGNYCDPMDTTACTAPYECLIDAGNANGCSYCQVRCPYSCDPLDTSACSNYGSNYECTSWVYNGNDCKKCQPVITSSTTTATVDPCSGVSTPCDPTIDGTDFCKTTYNVANYQCAYTGVGNGYCGQCQPMPTTTNTATTTTTATVSTSTATVTSDCLGSGGCYGNTNCKDPTPICDWTVSGTNGICGVCVATTTIAATTSTTTDACNGVVTCNDASECMNGTPGTANYGSCTDVNNDGCKICVYPTTTTKVATTSTTTATATSDCLGGGGCYGSTNCKDPTPVCDWTVSGTNGNCGVCVATTSTTTNACNGAVTCNDASECMNGTPGTAHYGSCTDANNDGCKICVYPTTTTKAATTSTTATATATSDCLGSGGCYGNTNCKDPTPICHWNVPGTNGNCGICVAAATTTTKATTTDKCNGVVTCNDASECTNGAPGTSHYGSCVDVNNDGCKRCIYPTTTTKAATLSTTKDRCTYNGQCILGAIPNTCSNNQICKEVPSSNLCGICKDVATATTTAAATTIAAAASSETPRDPNQANQYGLIIGIGFVMTIFSWM